MTHFTNANNENCDDSPRELCYFLETLIPKWNHNYTSKEYLAMNEHRSFSKGGLHFPIQNPTKRERCGVKIMLFD